MNRSMHRNQCGMLRFETSDAIGSAMGRAVVHYPEDAAGLVVRRLVHNLGDELIERVDAASPCATSKQLETVNIQSGDVGPGSTPRVFMFHLHGQTGLGWHSLMASPSGLNTGFLIGRQNELVILQRTSLPNSFVQIQNAPSFLREVGIARENPAAVLPGPDRIIVEPAPDGRAANRCNNARLNCLGGQIPCAPSRERNLMDRGKFTGQRLDLNDHRWGEKPVGGPGEEVPPTRRFSFQENVCARSKRLHGAYRGGPRFRRYQALQRPSGSFWRVAPENALTYIFGIERSTRVPPGLTERSEMGFFLASYLLLLGDRMPWNRVMRKQ